MNRNDVVGIFLSDIFRFSESSDHLCRSLLIDFEPLTDLLVRGVLVEGDMVNKHIHIPVRNAVNLNGIKRCEVVHTHRKRRHILLLRRKALIVRLVHVVVEPVLVLIIANGLSFTTEHNQGRKSERAWAELREISDEICAEHGLSLIDPKGKGISYLELLKQKEGKSWKDKLRVRIAEVMLYSRDFAGFLRNCTASGIEYVYTPKNKYKLKFKLSGDGQQRFTRAETLGEGFTVESITEQIAEIQEKLSAENVTPDMLIELPKPVVPKTEPKQTVTAPTKPKQSAEPETINEMSETAKRKAAAEQVEKFFAARRARRQAQLDMLNATAAKPTEPKPEPSAPTPQPTPTESKAPEKKKDVWAAIRGMRDSDKMIADLEAGGITSLDDLRGFFWNFKHPDDHTDDEIHYLNRRIDDTELCNLFRQSVFEKLLIQLNDDLLLALSVINALCTLLNTQIELVECFLFLVECLLIENCKHILHNTRYGIVFDKLIIFKQSIEHRLCYHVLGKHLNCIGCFDRGI